MSALAPATTTHKAPLVEFLIFLATGLVASFTPLNKLVSAYLWEPPGALYTIMCLVVVETIATAFLGTVQLRTLLVRLGKFVFGYLVVFVVVHNLAKYDPSTAWLRPVVMNGAAGLHFIFLLRAFGKLGLMRPEVATAADNKLTRRLAEDAGEGLEKLSAEPERDNSSHRNAPL